MKALVLMFAATGLLSVAQAAPTKVRCTVAQISPANAMFGSMGGTPPTLGDKIDIDLKANEITDLTFESGNAIPLKEAKAKLVRKTAGQDYFEGTHRSRTSDYIGIVSFSHGEKQSQGSIQVLRKKFNAGMTLSTANLTCEHLN